MFRENGRAGCRMKKLGLLSVPTAVWVVVLVAGCLAPFVHRAYYIDDPPFLWAARQIRVAPAHFYDFKLNWSGLEMHMTDVTCNPPLTAFFLSAASILVGWREIALHLVSLLPAIAASISSGTGSAWWYTASSAAAPSRTSCSVRA
jgi:hypothetical protein